MRDAGTTGGLVRRLRSWTPVWAGMTYLLLAGCSDLFPPEYEYGTVEAVVERRDGSPVPGVPLTLYRGERHVDYGETGDDGWHVFEYVPMGSHGVYAHPPSGYLALDEIGGYAVTFRAEEGSRDTVRFTYLKIGDGAVAVRAVDTAGEPLAGVYVQLYTHTGVIDTGTTDATGTHVFDPVPFGGHGVFATAPIGYRVAEGGGSFTWQDGLLIDEGWTESVQFTFEPCVGTLRVVARDQNGQPAQGLRLLLYTWRGPVAEAVTGADGVHRFAEVGCGEYGVRRLESIGYSGAEGPGGRYVDGILVNHGDAREVAFSVERCSGRVRANVVDGAGNPVAGAALTLYTAFEVVDEAQTGASGEHVFDPVGCFGDYGIKVTPPSGYTVSQGRGSSHFDGFSLSQGEELGFTFVLTRS